MQPELRIHTNTSLINCEMILTFIIFIFSLSGHSGPAESLMRQKAQKGRQHKLSMFACMYIHMYVCMEVCVYVCMYVCSLMQWAASCCSGLPIITIISISFKGLAHCFHIFLPLRFFFFWQLRGNR